MRRRVRVLFAILAALAIVVVLLLPPRPRPVAGSADGTLAARATARGAYHIHTNRSDGTGSVDDVAAAAARAGLQFVVLTDHGDGTRAPLAPSVRGGVLVLDGVEISTTGGHYVALGLDAATPYRLAGEPRDVVEDVRRLGGFGIAAHPDSPKTELQWSGWDTGIDGLEWLNTDTEWRDESRAALIRALTTYPWRPAETLAALIRHDRPLLTRWDTLTRTHRIVGLAGVDAHARIGLREGPDPYGGRVLAKIPSYEASFRTFALHAELAAPLTGDAARDGAALLDAIRSGHIYTTIDALAAPPAGAPAVGFEASTGDTRARMGDFLAPAAAGAGAVDWRASVAAPEGATTRLMCDGRLAAEGPSNARLTHRHEAGQLPSACRVEAGWDDGGQRMTWLVTNPIYLRASDPAPRASSTSPDAAPPVVERLPGDFSAPNAWAIERDEQSTAAWRWIGASPSSGASPAASAVASPGAAHVAASGALELTFQLRAGGRVNQYAAFVTQQVGAIARATRVSFRASADKPTRLSVQVRRPLDPPSDGERWRRSVYVDPAPREITVLFDDMRPVSPARDPHPPLDKVHALLIVVDTEHTPPGGAGVVRIEDLRLER